MLTDGIELVEGSDINNPVIESGATLPGIAINGQLYYLTVGTVGLHIFDQGNWVLLGESGSLSTHIANDVVHLSSTQNDLLNDITITPTEFDNIIGATSNIQAQLDNLPANSVSGTVGNLISYDASNNLQDAGINASAIKAGRKNKIINGNFDFWQRGSSFTDEGYTADRWRMGFSTGFTTDSAQDIEFFEMLGDNYVSITTEDVTNSGIGSKIYKFNTTTNTFDFFQQVSTEFNSHSTYFEIGGDHYLFVATVIRNGNHVTTSDLFKFNTGTNQFEFHQNIPTQGAKGADFVTIGTNHYLMVANASDGITNNINSFLYKWNFGTTQFDLHQNIFAFGAQNVTFFNIGVETYMALAEPSNFPTTNIVAQQILKYNSGTDQFDLFQTMPPIIGGLDWEHFEIAGDHYLASAEHSNGNTINLSSRIFIYNSGTDQFDLFQTIPTIGAASWTHFVISGEHYLACAYSQGGPGFGSFNDIDSEIFKFNTGTNQFDSYQFIPTHMIQDWGYALISGEHYLLAANRALNGNFIADSKLYKFNTGTTFFEEQSVVNASMVRQTAGGTSPIESRHFVDLTSDISTGSIGIEQRVEDVLQFNGETLTLSFYARSDVNSTLIVNLNRVGILGVVEPSDISLSQSVDITPTWEKHSFTFSWSHLTNAIDPINYLAVGFVSDAGIVTSTFISDVQLEEGSLATPLEFRHPSIELDLCQRYYNKSYDLESIPGSVTDSGVLEHKVIAGFASVHTVTHTINFPVAMRTVPALTVFSDISGTPGVINMDGTDRSIDSANIGDKATSVTVTNSTSTTNRTVRYHYTADAEL